jgi:hypothetical protein
MRPIAAPVLDEVVIEGLLAPLSETKVRDLIAYLVAGPDPAPLPK